MAYLRKEKKKGKTYLSICESYRDSSGKSAHLVLHNLGNLETLGEHSLQQIANQILKLTNAPVPATGKLWVHSGNFYNFKTIWLARFFQKN